MSAFKGLILSAVVGSMLAGTAVAGNVIGTEKARGHFGGNGWTQMHAGRRHANDGQRAVRYASRPVVVQSTIAAPVAAPTAVAQAPAEGRRFSYAPTTGAAASQPAATVPPVAVQSTVMQPSYYHAPTRHHSADKWALQKTDPRKYSSR